jgi:LysR family transcriptional regulator, transcriptional activator for bauABCD operon
LRGIRLPTGDSRMTWPHRLFASQFTDFELKLLRVFRAVVECGGFSPAEVELGLTKSAISKHISDLEIRLGVRLCERGRGGFALTEEGKVVYESTTQLMVALEEFRSRVNAFHSELIGEFYIGFVDTLVTSDDNLLEEILADYVHAHPSLKINMIVGSESDIDRAIEERRLHIGVSVIGDSSSKMLLVPLWAETSYLYCGRQHPLFDLDDKAITDEALASHPLAKHGYSAAETRLIGQLELKPMATAHQTEGVLFLVLAGKHLGFLPSHFARIWAESGRIRAIRPDAISKVTKITIKAHRSSLANPMVRSFLDIERVRVESRG